MISLFLFSAAKIIITCGIWGTEKKEYWGGMRGSKLMESGQ
jgi:hypothetical protein